MKDNNKLYYVILEIIIFFFPILPLYIYFFAGINLVNFLMIIFLLWLLARQKITVISSFEFMRFIGIYGIFNALMCLRDAEVITFGTQIIAYVIFPYIVITYVNEKDKFIRIVDILILGGFILGCLGVIEAICGVNIFQNFSDIQGNGISFHHDVRYGLKRVMSTFGQPIGYGMYQVFILTLITYRLGSEITITKKRKLKIAYVLCFVNVFLSVSRIPIIAIAMIYVLIILLSAKRKYVNGLAIGILILIFTMLFCEFIGYEIPIISDLWRTIFLLIQGVDQGDKSTIGIGNRLDIWYWLKETLVGPEWIWGRGYAENFSYQVNAWTVKTSLENQYLNVLFHTGLIGVSILVGSYVATMIYLWKNKSVYISGIDRTKYGFNKLNLALLFTYFCMGFGVQETDMRRLYVVLIALVIVYNRLAKNEKVKEA